MVLARNNVKVVGPEAGSAQTLLLAHGFGCDQTMWRRMVPTLSTTYRVVCFDYVGAGRSDRSAYRSERYRTLDGYARDVREICDALELRHAIFVGHSVSGMIGALASIAEPSLFDRLIMVAPSPRYLDDPPDYQGGFTRADIDDLLMLMDQNFIGWASTFADVAARDPVLARELSQSFCSTDPRAVREFAEATFFVDHREDLPRIPVPTLVVQCTDDDIAPVSVGRYMCTRLRQATYRELEVSGHIPHMSHPRELEALIRGWLAEAPGA